MKRLILSITVLLSFVTAAHARDAHDIGKPFGWAVCTSLKGGDYALSGGAEDASKGVEGRSVTLTAAPDGKDMRDAIKNAVRKYDIVILDGSAGDFPISRTIELKDVRNKTIVGINGARMCSVFEWTGNLRVALSDIDRRLREGDYPPPQDGWFMLPNGRKVSEAVEYVPRKILLEVIGDPEEPYRSSGVFAMEGCENIIIRNLDLVGPGSLDVGGDPQLRLTAGTKHVWIDHCRFTDAIKTHVAIGRQSDFITFSWCEFFFTDKSIDHNLSNLIASSDNAPKERGYLNVTYAWCRWGAGNHGRVPMARYGHIHCLNNYYDCVGTMGINPRAESTFLVEGNWFEDGVKAFCTKFLEKHVPDAYVFRDNRYGTDDPVPQKGEVTMPYRYKVVSPKQARKAVLKWCGAVLTDPLK